MYTLILHTWYTGLDGTYKYTQDLIALDRVYSNTAAGASGLSDCNSVFATVSESLEIPTGFASRPAIRGFHIRWD